jgi:hypothetical protein
MQLPSYSFRCLPDKNCNRDRDDAASRMPQAVVLDSATLVKSRPALTLLATAESIFVLVLCVCEQNSGLLIEKKLKKQFPKVITLHH